MGQFVVTFPVQLRLWMARSKSLCAKVCEKVCAELTAHLRQATGIEKGLSGLVVFIQRYLEKVEDMVLVGNTDDTFSESGQHFNEDIYLPAQVASVAHRIAFGPNAGQPVRRLKTQTSLRPEPKLLLYFISSPINPHR